MPMDEISYFVNDLRMFLEVFNDVDTWSVFIVNSMIMFSVSLSLI